MTATGNIGGVADYNAAGMINGGNTWNNNRYFMPDEGDRFRWAGPNGAVFYLADTSKISRLPAVRVARFHRPIPAPKIGGIYLYTENLLPRR